MTDVLAGRVDMMFAPTVVVLPHIESGAERGLSITSPDRSPLLPEAPTVRETGLREAETEAWIGLFAPARTPEAVIGTLYDGLVRALNMTAVREGFGKEGSDVVIDASPAVFSHFVDEGITTWAKIVQQSGATIDRRTIPPFEHRHRIVTGVQRCGCIAAHAQGWRQQRRDRLLPEITEY
jgi:tripartite-type tricarboxylate transporter receptor subunit TctC